MVWNLDLTRPEYTKLFFMKGRVFQRRIMNIHELKEAILTDVAAIGEDLRRRVYDNIKRRYKNALI